VKTSALDIISVNRDSGGSMFVYIGDGERCTTSHRSFCIDLS
jgi:hypothetical protein